MASKHEIFNQAYQTYMQTGYQRKGQATFNAVYDVDPALADSLRGTELDCFYNDSKIGQFMQVVCDSWDKGTHPPDDRDLKHREEHGRVVVEQDRCRDYEDEITLKVTHNGYQYSCISLSKQEATKAVELLRAHFNI